ncbi:MAG: hypothetical protein GQ564_16815 [Bacteroidales bacterium]|nr:hypothetical protein [Bacteroidales bacterium]
MEENDEMLNSFDESQSIQVIKEMIQVSQKNLKNDGILFILWGWLMFYFYVTYYILYKIVITVQMMNIFAYFQYAIGVIAIAFTLYYVYKKSKKVKTYIAVSLRYVWISLFAFIILASIMTKNSILWVNFEFQHSFYMMFIAFAIIITGGILRYKLVIIGGIIFGGLAYACSYFDLQIQLLFHASAWLIAFIIPGHILYAKRKQ